jgi:hypothetical protein
MTTPVILVADKIVELINTRTPGVESEDAARKYLPQLVLEDMGDKVYVTVMPVTEQAETLDRTEKTWTVEVDVGIQKKLANDEGDDDVLILKKELTELLFLKDFDDINAEYTGIETVALFNQEMLIEKRVLISVIRIGYMVTE